MRHLEFDFTAVSCADTAIRLAREPLSGKLQMKGFLSPRTMRSVKLTIHVTEYTN
jgi:primosomal replication protein N